MDMTPNDTWDRFVGWQSPDEFMEVSDYDITFSGVENAINDYVTDSFDNWALESDDELDREKILNGLVSHACHQLGIEIPV